MTTVTLIHPDTQDKIKVSPMAINIPLGELNENLQHVAQTCQANLVYEPELLELFALKTNISAIVEDEFGTLFTGLIDTSVTWTDNGLPTPIDAIQVKIHDNTRLLDRQTTDEVALINTTVAAAVRRICTDCGVEIKEGAKLPLTTLTAFVLDAGTSYLQALNNLLFQHEAAFVFTPDGELDVIQFGEIPDDLPLLGPDKILTGFSPTRTAKKYEAIKVGYTPLTKQKGQQVYFEGNDLGDDNKIVPITVRPNQYYPYESDPVQEAREGQVYQEFANGYAESYQAYNGETKYRRSEKTSLLYTENHRLVQDWQGSISVDRTEFQARRSSVRLQNTGTADANLMQLAIRADAWYREPVSYVTFGTGSEYVYEGEYLYTAEAAEKLAGTLSRFFRGGNYKLSGRTTHKVTPGQFLRVDSGISGFTANALVLSCTFDPEAEIYSVQLVTYGDIAIDVHRYRAQAGRGDKTAIDIANLQNKIQGVLTGDDEEIGPPDEPRGVTVEAGQFGLEIRWQPPSPGLKNIIKQYVATVTKPDGQRAEVVGSGTGTTYSFHRPTDGYPEAADLDKWSVRVKAVNVYGKESGWSQETAPNTDTYGTWQLAAPKIVPQVKDRHITLLFSQPPRADGRQVYGDVTHAITIRRPDIDTDPDTWYTPGTSLNPYPETAGDGTERSNELNYKLDTTEPETRGEMYVQTMPLKGQGGDGKGIENTLYLFRVVGTNEAGESPATTVQAVALCTNIVDLVNANTTQKEAYVPDLSAISANLGSINQGGMGNDNNRWDLSTFVDPRGIQRWEGLFRVGSPNQYLHVNPIINDIGQIIDYEIIFKVGKFELSSTASNIKGEVIVMADDRPWERTRITPTGTYYEYLPSQEAGWQTVAKQETRGLMSQLMYSGQSIILTNSSITQRRRNGIDLGRPYLSEHSLVYHFDEDFLDQHGNRGYTLEGQAQLVDMDDNTPLVPIDFTAAILSVAPYSEVGKSAYGQFSITHPLGDSNVFTVDFWIQYIWAENQVLLDIGVPSDRIQIICSSGEPNYNEPQDGEPPYNWEIESADKMPYNVAAGSAVYANHQGIGSFDTIDLEDIGFEFTPNTWEHLAVVLTDTEITLYLRDRRLHFTRYGTGIQEATAILNAGEMSFQLDEMLVDTTRVREFEDFVAGTHDKVPWAALDHKKKHYILDAAEPDNITGNIFTSRTFEEAVLRVLEKNKETT